MGGAFEFGEDVTGDHDGGAVFREGREQFAEVGDAGRVQAIGWFVEHDKLGAVPDGARQGEALFHAEGERGDGRLGGGGEADPLEKLVHGCGWGDPEKVEVQVEDGARGGGGVELGRFDGRADA